MKTHASKPDSPSPSLARHVRDDSHQRVQKNQLSTATKTKLATEQPGDASEREADRIADRVMANPGAEPGHPAATVQKPIQARPQAGQSLNNPVAPHGKTQLLQGDGQPLSSTERNFFEPRFGMDFSHVRIHRDAHAASVALSLGARAFTHGHKVAFGQGEYSSSRLSGRKLLAHELTHVVQQSRGKPLLQLKPLPKKEFEAVTYTFQRLVSELDDLIDNGKTKEAKEKAKQVISYGSSEIMAQMYGYDAAKALFRLDMADEAEKILDLASKAYFGTHSRMQPSVDAVKLILDQAEAAFNASKVEYAYKLYEKAFKWLERYELTTTSTSALRSGADIYVKDLYPRLVTGIFKIPAHYKSGNQSKEQTAYLSKIKDLFVGSSIADRYSELVAQAFFDLKMVDEGIEILKEGHKDYTPSTPHNAWMYPTAKTDFLLNNTQAALGNQDWDTAYKLLVETFNWIKDNEKSMDEWALNFGEKRTFVEKSLYSLFNGLLTIVDHFINQAEQGFKNADPNASVHLTTAKSWIDKIEKDIPLSGTLVTIIVAKTHQKEKDSSEATYQDARDPSKKAMKVTGYEGDIPTGTSLLLEGFTFTDRKRRLDQIIEAKQGQLKSIKDFYETDKDVVAMFKTKKNREPDIHKIDDRKLFWSLKYDHLTSTQGKSTEDATQALMTSIDGYLGAFTIHSKYNISDAKVDVVSGDYPKSITNQALMDCGVFAMRTAYELSLIRKKANLDFYFVSILNHIMLGIVDQGLAYGWGASNNQIAKLGSNLSTDGVGRAVQDIFASIPTPLITTKIGKTDEASLVSQFKRLPDDFFLPDNFSKLNAADQKQARKDAERLKASYIAIRKDNIKGTYKVSAMLFKMRQEHEKLGKITDDKEKEKKKKEFDAATITKIKALRKPYGAYCDNFIDFHKEMNTIRGTQTYSSLSNPSFISNCFHMILYGAHQLGQPDWKSDKWVTSTALKGLDTTYTGSPPPWDSTIADLNFDRM
jgi:tetratricopeptide (TPR) repeat protein